MIKLAEDVPQFDGYEQIGSIYLMYRCGKFAGILRRELFAEWTN